MAIDAFITSRREAIAALALQHGARNIRVFGSRASGAARPDSDIDLLVDMEAGRSLVDIGKLLMDLEDLLGYKVDVVTEKSLHWYIRDQVVKAAIPLCRN